jgi:hypothetical protein
VSSTAAASTSVPGRSASTVASPTGGALAADTQFDVTRLSLFFQLFGHGRWVSYRCCNISNQVHVHDVKTRTDRIVFRSRGEASWIVGDGNTLVWIDQSATQSDTEPKVDWVMYAQDLLTGRRTVLTRVKHNLVPLVRAGAGHVVWAGDPIGGGNPFEVVSLHDWRIGDPAGPRVLAKQIRFGDGSESLTSRGVYFVGPAVTGPDARGGDVYFLPWSGGKPTPLTRTGLVDYVAASADDSTVGFQQKDPQAEFNQPYSTWYFDHGTSQRIERKMNNGNLVAGTGFLAWMDGLDVRVSILDGAASNPLTLSTDLAPGSFLRADGSQLVYGTRPADATDSTPTRVHVVTVRRDG